MINYIDILILGAIAGFTIFLGLPLIIFSVSDKTKGLLNALAAGILLFLLVEVLADSWEATMEDVRLFLQGQASSIIAIGDMLFLFFGLALGLIGLSTYENRFMKSNKADANIRSKIATMIALGIGAHNLSEGLAIGQSYAAGAVSLALLLIIGFGAHNTTEGFGILAPIVGLEKRPKLSFVLKILFIGGAPTFFGTILGSMFFSTIAYIFFLSLAGGALIYVIMIMYNIGRRQVNNNLFMLGLFVGLMLGFLTDMIISLSGI